eukprot:scaffold104975_cov24-Prasinocladus_malaysianus.AAC.1
MILRIIGLSQQSFATTGKYGYRCSRVTVHWHSACNPQNSDARNIQPVKSLNLHGTSGTHAGRRNVGELRAER